MVTTIENIMRTYFLSTCMLLLLVVCNAYTKAQTTVVQEENLAKKNPPQDIIHLTARPDSISFNAANAAVIVVDMQNDFGTKGGMFDRAGIDISIIQAVVDPISKVLNSARKKGIQVIYLKMGFKQDLSDVGGMEYPTRVKRFKRMHIGDTLIAPDGKMSRILVHDTWNTEIVQQLYPQDGDII